MVHVAKKYKQSICPGCGQHFACGALNGEQRCWCMAQPVGACEPTPGASCFCPACLKARSGELPVPAA